MSKRILSTLAAVAAADLSGKQYHAVRHSAAGQVNQSSDAADTAYAGVLLNKPEANEHATVGRGGIGKITCGAAVSANALITTNGSGRAVAISSGDTSMVIGRVLEAATADGDIVKAELFETPHMWPALAL